MHSSKSEYHTKLEAVQVHNIKNLERAKKSFTGKVTVNWTEGRPTSEEILVRKPIK